MKSIYVLVGLLVGILIGASGAGIYFNQQNAALQEKYVKLQGDYRKLEENYTTLQENYEKLQANYTEVKIFKEVVNAPCYANIVVSFQGFFREIKYCDGKLKIIMEEGGKIAELPLSPNVIVYVYEEGQIKDFSLTNLKRGDVLAADALVASDIQGILKTMDQIEIIRIRVFPMSP